MAKPVWTDAQIILQMDSGAHWSGNSLTYGFPTTASWFPYGERSGFSALNGSQQAAATTAIKLWDDLITPQVTLAADGTTANIKFSNTTTSIGYAQTYFPGGTSASGSVWFNPNYGASSGTNNLVTPTAGEWGFATYIHETGHAFGLNHPGNYNGGSPTYPTDALFMQDSQQYTIMSYFDASATGADWVASDGKMHFAQTPMLEDIVVIQSMYGADTTTRAGNTTYGFHSNADIWLFNFELNPHPVLCIYDASGNDTLDLSGWNTPSTINLAPGSFSNCDMMTNNVSIAKTAWIENAIGGGGNDTVTGNILNNVLDGRGGNDTLTGAGGHDTFVYGVSYGADTVMDFVIGGAESDRVDLTAFQSIVSLAQLFGFATQSGSDTVLTFSPGNTLTLHNVTLGSLLDGDFLFYGSAPPPSTNLPPTDVSLSNSTILENAVGGLIGNVQVTDPSGDSFFTFDVSDARFEVVLAGGQYQLKLVNGAWLDYETEHTVNLTITATDPGGLSDQEDFVITVDDVSGANVIGTSSNDTIDATHTPASQAFVGNEDDVINGFAGSDTMAGGLGNDTYVVDNTSDRIIENPGQGLDTILASVTYTLPANVENLILTGLSAINGTGNAVANSLVGNSANNTLAGLGGADALDGGDGIDTATYAASLAGVNVSLQTGMATGGDAEGDTLVRVENLTGSNFSDTLEGDGGNNVLIGGNGSDTVSYAHAAAGVVVSLAITSAQNTVGAGIDTLSRFENLTGSQFDDTLTGNSGANVLIGLGGNDVLVGGSGADTMVGGDGDDRYTMDNSGDVVDETTGSGIDTVNTSITFSLADALHVKGDVENLTLTGTGNVNGTGNALDNAITGNGGANVVAGLGGADILDGGAGSDTVTYAASSVGVNVSLMTHLGSGGDAEGDTLFSVEKLTGSNFDDTLEGDGAANVLSGGTGIDTVSYEHAAAGVTVNLATTSAQNTLGAGSDTLSGFENLTGSQFDDILLGTTGANTILGGAGNDRITGGGGTDILAGGADADTFIFRAAADSAPSLADVITDFLEGTDKIDLSAIDSNSAVSGNQAFLYGGESQIVVANSVTWFQDQATGNTVIQADLNGNNIADMQIVLTGLHPNLHATDFVL